jgi:hypothetical protein
MSEENHNGQPDGPFDLDALFPPRKVPFTYRGKPYELRPATEGTGQKFKTTLTRGGEAVSGGPKDKRSVRLKPENSFEAQLVLVGECLHYAEGEEGQKHHGKDAGRAVGVNVVKTWDCRAVEWLTMQALEISDLKAPADEAEAARREEGVKN